MWLRLYYKLEPFSSVYAQGNFFNHDFFCLLSITHTSNQKAPFFCRYIHKIIFPKCLFALLPLKMIPTHEARDTVWDPRKYYAEKKKDNIL